MVLIAFFRDNARWLGAGIILYFASSFGQTFFISVFAGQIMGTFGLTDGEWGAIYALGTTLSAIVMIWAGGLTDQHRVRLLGAIFLAGLAAAALGMAVNPYVALLPIVIFALRFCGQGMLGHIAHVAMVRWFARARGKALAVLDIGIAAGEAFLPMVFAALLVFVDWRLLWLVAALVLFALIPAVNRLLLVERHPQQMTNEVVSLGMAGRHWTRAQALRHWLFWCLLPIPVAASTFGTALFFQQVHLAEVKGFSHGLFVAMIPVFTLTVFVFSVITGLAVDRWGARRILPIGPVPMAAGFLVLAWGHGAGTIAATFVLVGAMSGINTVVFSAGWAELYGTRHIGAIKAAAAAAMVAGSALGPAVTGVLIDLGWSFPAQMPAIAALSLAAAALGVFAVRRSAPMFAQATQVHV